MTGMAEASVKFCMQVGYGISNLNKWMTYRPIVGMVMVSLVVTYISLSFS